MSWLSWLRGKAAFVIAGLGALLLAVIKVQGLRLEKAQDKIDELEAEDDYNDGLREKEKESARVAESRRAEAYQELEERRVPGVLSDPNRVRK